MDESRRAQRHLAGHAHADRAQPGPGRADDDHVFREDHRRLGAPTPGNRHAITAAEPGVWQVQLQAGTDIPTAGTGYSLLAIFDSALDFSAESDRSWYHPGDSVTLSVSLSPAPSAASVVAELLFPEGVRSAWA